MSVSCSGTNNSEDGMLSMDSPTIDEGGSSGGNSSAGGGGGGGGGGGRRRGGGGVVLKKGPWTSAEDMILVEYVKKHGEGNWNAVQKYSGLSRCGKSCRLRWANHLRPNLKKGAFTPEEERLIIELHAKMGNKWARMAAHLPGRTDNEIKNYWNTRIKRRQRAGLPLYPPELCVQPFQENQQNQNGHCIQIGDEGHSNHLHMNGYNVPDMFGNLSTNQGVLPYIPPLPYFSSSLMKGLSSPQLYSFINPTRPCQKRLREPQKPLSEYDGAVGNEGPQFYRDQDDNCRSKGSQSFDMCFPYHPDTITKQLLSFGANQGRQSLLNGNFSASKPTIGAVKLELPSLQYPEDTIDSWFSHSSQPAFESVDSLIQSPPAGSLQSECPSPRSSGLLEALVYEALSGSKNPSSEKSSNSSTFIPGDMTECSPLNKCSAHCEGCGNPNSPFGNSSASIFSECTPISATKSSLEENPSSESFSEWNVKPEPMDHTWNMDGEEKETQLQFPRPDAILGSCWLRQSASCVMTDAIAALLGDDLSSDFKNMGGGTSDPSTSLSFGSCSWKNMPPACKMSEFP